MPDSIVIEPSTYRTITHTLQIRTDAQFAADYDKYVEVCRAVYNRAVHEAALDGPERRAYAPYKPKERKNEDGETEKGPYLDRETYKMAKVVAEKMGVDVSVIRDMVRSRLGGFAWHYGFPPNSRATRNRIGLLLTKWRAKHAWMRECPVLYEMGAIRNAVNAVDRSISDNSDTIPIRHTGRRAALFCPSNQAVNRKGPRELRVPGFTIHTRKAMPKEWDIRSCQLVETTPYRTQSTGRGGRTFEIHVQIRERIKRQPTNVMARGVDLGGKHIAATADTTGRTTLQTMPHSGLWREIRALQSERDQKRKGGHAWLAIDKKIRVKRGKANRMGKNARLQGAAFVSRGVCHVILEVLNLKAMMKRGGNRKRRLNDMLQMAGIGGFRGMIIRNAARNGARIILVDAKNTSNECTICEFVSKESRVSRDSFICINCGDESHADINAACVVLKRGIIQCPVDRAEGQAVLRRRATPRNQPTQWPAWPRKRGLDPPHLRWGRQKITQLEIQSRL